MSLSRVLTPRFQTVIFIIKFKMASNYSRFDMMRSVNIEMKIRFYRACCYYYYCYYLLTLVELFSTNNIQLGKFFFCGINDKDTRQFIFFFCCVYVTEYVIHLYTFVFCLFACSSLFIYLFYSCCLGDMHVEQIRSLCSKNNFICLEYTHRIGFFSFRV